jgi:hypothetical protein
MGSTSMTGGKVDAPTPPTEPYALASAAGSGVAILVSAASGGVAILESVVGIGVTILASLASVRRDLMVRRPRSRRRGLGTQVTLGLRNQPTKTIIQHSIKTLQQ